MTASPAPPPPPMVPVSADPSSAVPVFGKRDERAGAIPTRRFRLEVTFRRRGRTVTEEVELTSYLNLDAGGVLRIMQARTEMEQANATAFLLATSLVDDDGVPSDWTPPAEDEPALENDEDEDSPALREDGDPDGALLYERWDGELVRYEDLAFDEFEDGSSRRRFAYIMASSGYRVELDALTQTSKWLVEQHAGRPTGRSTPSGHGPSSTRRGSGGRRR